MRSGGPEYRLVPSTLAERANRDDWDRYADEYQDEHGAFLGDVSFRWCPEGVDESDARILGDVTGQRVLELGSGAAQCARWLRTQGATAIAFDLSYRQQQHARRIDDDTGIGVPAVQATVSSLPFGDSVFDVAFSAFGALSFVVDLPAVIAEVARVLRPGGTLAASVVHPSRWMFPDDPTSHGMTITRSYFDRTPYVETDGSGATTYVEPHHTWGDWVEALNRAGFSLRSLVEPEWPAEHDRVWGGWGPERGAMLPGTAILRAELS